MPPHNPIPPQPTFQTSFQTPMPTVANNNDNNHRFHRKEGIKNIVYTVLLFIFAPLFALVMIMFVFQSYVVDGSSMEPNLQNGNRVFILKLPKTMAAIRGKDYIPGRYEVIVFKKPSDPGVQLIKRVIGLPGDHVVVKNNKITIINNDNPTGFNPDEQLDVSLLNGETVGNVDVIVGQNELFVCGDNRSPGGSLDSRNNLGLVPVQNIIGRLWIRYYPLSDFKLFSFSGLFQQFAQIPLLFYR